MHEPGLSQVKMDRRRCCARGTDGIPLDPQQSASAEPTGNHHPDSTRGRDFSGEVSFDHYFATYPVALNNSTAEPAFTALPNTPSVNGLNGPLLTNNPNSTQPFRLTRAQSVTCDQDHNYNDEQKAFDSGLMDKFVESVRIFQRRLRCGWIRQDRGDGLLRRQHRHRSWNYAQYFAMSDNSFGTTFGPSAPGVINLISGNTHGATVTAGSAAGNVGSGGSLMAMRARSFAGRLYPGAPQDLRQHVGQKRRRPAEREEYSRGFFQGGSVPPQRRRAARPLRRRITSVWPGTMP